VAAGEGSILIPEKLPLEEEEKGTPICTHGGRLEKGSIPQTIDCLGKDHFMHKKRGSAAARKEGTKYEGKGIKDRIQEIRECKGKADAL